jgi:hypothetical protein
MASGNGPAPTSTIEQPAPALLVLVGGTHLALLQTRPLVHADASGSFVGSSEMSTVRALVMSATRHPAAMTPQSSRRATAANP